MEGRQHRVSAQYAESMKASGISDRAGMMALFSTHPPIEERIAALQSR